MRGAGLPLDSALLDIVLDIVLVLVLDVDLGSAMLSSHYTGTPPVHPHSQHTPLDGHGLPILPSLPSHQAQYAHQQHAISTLLPTPPSSPPTIGMHPVESTISLLESLVAFYHQERMWVYRTRAQLEMGLLHRASESPLDSTIPINVDLDGVSSSPPGQLHAQLPGSPDPGKSPKTSSPSPPTKWLKRKKAFNLRLEGISSTRSMVPTVARGGITKHSHPHTQHRARQSSNLNPATAASHQHTVQASSSATLHPQSSIAMNSSNTSMSFYPPTAVNTTTLTSPYLSHPSFQFPTTSNQQPLTPGASTTRYPSTPTTHQPQSIVQPSQPPPTHTSPVVLGAGGREPSVQILEMFERMMQARMESCERMTRMVRGANSPGGIGNGGSTSVSGGIGPGSVGGPVGGFGGPVGLPVGVGPQGIMQAYPHAQAQAPSQEPEMMQPQTPGQQGFPVGVGMT